MSLNTPKIKTIIVEDNIESQKYLITLIEKHFPSIEIVKTCVSVQDTIETISTANPELIFMDIELTDGTAFEIFEHVNTSNLEIIFITAHENYIKRAIDHFAFSYITKPYDKTELISKIKHYLNLKERLSSKEKLHSLTNFLHSKNASFLIHTGNEYISVKTSDIIKCEASGNYTIFHLNSNLKHLASNSLKYYYNLLGHKQFFKAHRSIIINIEYIKSIYKKETIVLKNEDKIHVSTRNKTRLIELVKSLS